MATRGITVRIVIRPRWWVKWYLFGVWCMSVLTGLNPDMEKVEAMVRRGIAVKMTRRDA